MASLPLFLFLVTACLWGRKRSSQFTLGEIMLIYLCYVFVFTVLGLILSEIPALFQVGPSQ